MFRKIKILWRQWRCKHPIETAKSLENGIATAQLVKVFPPHVIGDWQEPEPHPHPHFRDKLKVQRQPVVAIRHCTSCGKWEVIHGYNQRDVIPPQPELPLGENKKWPM